ncbi:MAG: response regulator [Planctomycetes bacterium]|nr:response regulator [Planctomycetota bacterium]MCP4839833.1 response regulator [Planctomycetota bacterium]
MTMFDKDVFTTGEVAKICNVAARTVSKWFDSGQLQGYRIPGSKDRRIPVASLMQFMKAHGIPLDGLMSGSTRVLICDMDDSVCEALSTVLKQETNYEVHTSSDLFSMGLECERFRPHVLLMDVNVPNFDSSKFMASIRCVDDLSAMRVIAMSGSLTDGQAASLERSGFDGTLRKPFTVRQVIDCIEAASAFV